MEFWNNFIRAVYFCCRSHLARGLVETERLFALACTNGLFRVEETNDASLVLLAAACRSSGGHSGLRPRVDAEFVSRGLHEPGAIVPLQALFANVPSTRYSEMMAVLINGDVAQRAQVTEIFQRMFGPRLRLFLSRLLLVPPIDEFHVARATIENALDRLTRIPLDTIDPVSLLYSHALQLIATESPMIPNPIPGWFASLPNDEQRFLRVCVQNLDHSDRVLVFLTYYARLNVLQLVELYSLTDNWTEDQILFHIVRCWRRILQIMVGDHPTNGRPHN